ncbi:MAG: hypothetical protein ACJAWL_002966 [Motiliproteus sp.]|jgi:hypothetical protein
MKIDNESKKEPLTLAEKKAFVVRTRSKNYRASLRLEGFNPVEIPLSEEKTSKQSIIAKYRMTAG